MKFRLYTKSSCPFCHAAIALLAEHKKEFECYGMDQQPELLTEIQDTYHWRTVPVAVEVTAGKEKFIGGFTGFEGYLNTSKPLR